MKHCFLLKGVRVLNPRESFTADIRIRAGLIQEMGPDLREEGELLLRGHGLVACPGLINSHDHLQFNLYPRIGQPPYDNAYEWGKDILSRYRPIVSTIEHVPLRIRYLWGAWKNLFSGVTYVVHHDPSSVHMRFFFPIDVLRRYTFAHSIGNESDLQRILARRKQAMPFVIHVAEGRDAKTAREMITLNEMGGLDERTVAVHAVNINQGDIDVLRQKGSSVVWCPSSNLFLFQRTTPVGLLWGKVPLNLGTDSTLTGLTTMFDEMRTAKDVSTLSARDIFSLVTENPQRSLGLPSDTGKIVVGGRATLFLLKEVHDDPYESLLRAGPQDILLLLRCGRPVFHDPEPFYQLGDDKNHSLTFNGIPKYLHHDQSLRLYRRLAPFLQHYSYLSGN